MSKPIAKPATHSTSPKKVQANRANAKASTGPKTPAGKEAASANATAHGILSRELLLPHEDADEYNTLLSSLITELGAQGTLERVLVERIAVAIWRQRRLVRAEHQDIKRQNTNTANPVPAALGIDLDRKAHTLLDENLIQCHLLNFHKAAQLDALETELRMLPAAPAISPAEYTQAFPLFSRFFPRPEAAKSPFAKIGFVAMYGEPKDLQLIWLNGIARLRTELANNAANQAALQAVSTPSNTESLARYQAALDNEWYKAMRAFREARQHRLRTLKDVSSQATGSP